MSPQFFTFDNKKLYAVSDLGRDKLAAVVFDPMLAKEEKVLYENTDYDVDQLVYSRARKWPATWVQCGAVCRISK